MLVLQLDCLYLFMNKYYGKAISALFSGKESVVLI